MLIRRFQITDLRNLSRVSLPQLDRINVFYGANGSGKTSLLEALHMLLVGRSFRLSQVKPVIQDGKSESVVFAELQDESSRTITLGMRRQRDAGKPVVLLNHYPIDSLAELVHIAPVQVFSSESFEIVAGGPSRRRQFIDWGLFHVEPSFYPTWRLAQRALKQRNTLLRHGKIPHDQLELWTREYARYGQLINDMRREYMSALITVASPMLSELSPALSDLQLSYYQGWNKDLSLGDALEQSSDGDKAQCLTRVGPHRADLKMYVGSSPASEVLSRGQQKALVAGLLLSQTNLLRQRANKISIFLVDDLGAELDRMHRQRFCQMLERLGVQVFATSIEKDELTDSWPSAASVSMFHVERGEISPCSPIRGIE